MFVNKITRPDYCSDQTVKLHASWEAVLIHRG